jgi:voltage-gated potassium channel
MREGDRPPMTRGRALRIKMHEVIFESDTPAGRAFDIVLLWAILLSVAAVVLESVGSVRAAYGPPLRVAEWTFTVLFTAEYLLRLLCVKQPLRYATSFFGVVDLLAVIPTYLSLFIGGAQALLVLRALRLLRVFRIFKLGRYLGEAKVLKKALHASRPKIIVFVGTVLTVVLIVGTLMYLIEGEANGFTSIPRSVYWAIVTMTTVGYGDVTPHTFWGQLLASCLMIVGYGVIAVPTGIVTVEIAEASRRSINTHVCRSCAAEGHDADALHCKYCGAKLR